MELVIPEIEEKLHGADGRKLRGLFKVLPPETGELDNLATDWERMKEIADKSGGQMYSANQASELIERLNSRRATRERIMDRPFWQSWWLLIPLLSLLTAEWLLRKWAGLA